MRLNYITRNATLNSLGHLLLFQDFIFNKERFPTREITIKFIAKLLTSSKLSYTFPAIYIYNVIKNKYNVYTLGNFITGKQFIFKFSII